MKAPKIRFPGFTDAWEQRKLIDVAASIDTGKSKFHLTDVCGHFPILGSTSVIGYDDSYDYDGDFIVTARVGANAGHLYRYTGKAKISDNTVFIQSNENVNFIFYMLTKFDIKQLSFGTGQPLVKASELKNINLLMPTTLEEQQQIGTFFKNLDDLITLHQRKLDDIKLVKQSLLQKMFPMDGENTPEIRFPGFTDAWEQRKLGTIADIVGGNAWKSIDYTENGSHLVVTIANVHGDYYMDDSVGNRINPEPNCTYELKENDILVSLTGNVGRVSKASKIKAVLNQRVGKIIPNNHSEEEFLFTVVHNNAFENAMIIAGQGAAQKNISNSDVLNYEFYTPNNIEEEQQIGTFFKNLDDLITLHQRKLDNLKQLKQALLQQMFI